jgi:hypothetical protein
MRKVRYASGSDGDEIPVIDNNMRWGMLCRKGVRESTGIRCHVTGSTSVEMPLVLWRLLEGDGLKIGGEGLLISDRSR